MKLTLMRIAASVLLLVAVIGGTAAVFHNGALDMPYQASVGTPASGRGRIGFDASGNFVALKDTGASAITGGASDILSLNFGRQFYSSDSLSSCPATATATGGASVWNEVQGSPSMQLDTGTTAAGELNACVMVSGNTNGSVIYLEAKHLKGDWYSATAPEWTTWIRYALDIGAGAAASTDFLYANGVTAGAVPQDGLFIRKLGAGGSAISICMYAATVGFCAVDTETLDANAVTVRMQKVSDTRFEVTWGANTYIFCTGTCGATNKHVNSVTLPTVRTGPIMYARTNENVAKTIRYKGFARVY
jgi:hypothetical protein